MGMVGTYVKLSTERPPQVRRYLVFLDVRVQQLVTFGLLGPHALHAVRQLLLDKQFHDRHNRGYVPRWVDHEHFFEFDGIAILVDARKTFLELAVKIFPPKIAHVCHEDTAVSSRIDSWPGIMAQT